ncbi:GTPase ObgE [Dethiosulfatarculus sandiegensis]|uniref:GTPase Obg n=1 Tax=Dethiosulfatarculus sandiegensis TaxID=1429043 RepID=A0A0D2JPE9_9BACT|nr:GTPase ObgE [Dethiosulfatarculus sandiegensis]KIX11365.1 GTPase CgtA [Dethiosulfatarculus sandiegensis]
MRFVDEATLEVAAGNGGKGCVSFLRMRFMPKGGPNGGDGGRGGNVILRASLSQATLADQSYLRHIRAGNGMPGQGSDKNGRSGENKIISVPVGTMATDVETGELLADLVEDGQEVILALGGQGGLGNRHFATSTNRTPRYAQPGEPGESLTVKLELKLLADVGLVGLPNAGKSSLIRALTQARPKVGDYPFTTLTPHLGVAFSDDGDPYTLADIPGLVAGAHQGAGLGLRFLKHVERTKAFILVVDLAGNDPLADLTVVQDELKAYGKGLAQRTMLVAANKMDLESDHEIADIFTEEINRQGLQVIFTSAVTGEGIDKLNHACLRLIREANKEKAIEQS